MPSQEVIELYTDVVYPSDRIRLATVCEDCIEITFSAYGGYPSRVGTVICRPSLFTRAGLECLLRVHGWRVLGWDSDTQATLW